MFESVYRDWQYSVAPEYGGNLCRLRWRGHDLLRFPERPEILTETPEVYGLPVLFPPGRIDEGVFFFRGKRCCLPVNEPARNVHLHGLALRRKWTVIERKENSFTLEMHYGEDAPEFTGYPFLFTLKLQYLFTGDELQQRLTVTNNGPEPMPFGAGFHTAFLNPETVCIPSCGCWETPQPRLLGTGRKVPWSEGFRPDRPFAIADLPHSCNFAAPAGPHTAYFTFDFGSLEYTVDEKFKVWCIWSPKPAAGFITVEPFTCFSGAFNAELPYDQSGVLVLNGKDQSTFVSSFRLLPKKS